MHTSGRYDNLIHALSLLLPTAARAGGVVTNCTEAALRAGGPTLTMAMLPGSPAIDVGNPSLALATDQRGVLRPFGLAADIGAFELWPTVQVSLRP